MNGRRGDQEVTAAAVQETFSAPLWLGELLSVVHGCPALISEADLPGCHKTELSLTVRRANVNHGVVREIAAAVQEPSSASTMVNCMGLCCVGFAVSNSTQPSPPSALHCRADVDSMQSHSKLQQTGRKPFVEAREDCMAVLVNCFVLISIITHSNLPFGISRKFVCVILLQQLRWIQKFTGVCENVTDMCED